jgi:hypothetical protein
MMQHKVGFGQGENTPAKPGDHTKHISRFSDVEKEEWPIFKEWNCWLEFNFPSECHGFHQWQAREKRNLSRISGWKPTVDQQTLEQEELREQAEAQLH